MLGSNVTLTVTPPAGTHVYTLTVDDGALTATDEVIVHVLEEEQPTIEVAGIEGSAGFGDDGSSDRSLREHARNAGLLSVGPAVRNVGDFDAPAERGLRVRRLERRLLRHRRMPGRGCGRSPRHRDVPRATEPGADAQRQAGGLGQRQRDAAGLRLRHGRPRAAAGLQLRRRDRRGRDPGRDSRGPVGLPELDRRLLRHGTMPGDDVGASIGRRQVPVATSALDHGPERRMAWAWSTSRRTPPAT